MVETPIEAELMRNVPKTPFDARSIRRPAPQLFTYYLVVAILTVPGVIFVLPMLWFRYLTLEYKFDDEGISMRWGFLFRREILLTYRKIQDIHLTRGLLQRWMGLATVSVQTASGNATPEMSIEGILQAEELRDFLYEKMRGAKRGNDVSKSIVATEDGHEVTEILVSIRDNLAKLVEAREGR